MSSRRVRVRSTIAVLLVCLLAVWGFAAYVTVGQGLHLLSGRILDRDVTGPTDKLVTALQVERLAAATGPGGGTGGDLAAARGRTDQARAEVAAATDSALVRAASPSDLSAALAALLHDAGPGTRDGVRDTVAIADAFQVLDLAGPDPDQRQVTALAYARELLAQEDAAVTTIVAAGPISAADAAAIARLVGARQLALTEAVEGLDPADRTSVAVPPGYGYGQLSTLEQAAMTSAGSTPFSVAQWRAAADPVLDQLAAASSDLATRVRQRDRPATIVTLVELALVLLIGLVGVIATLRLALTITRRLRALRAAADEVATQRLPAVVDRLGRGEPVDVSAEAPPLHTGPDELGRVGEAFNRMRETAVRTAIEQAELRRGVRDVFLSLARRSQALLHRQLGLLDAMERRAVTPDALAELFRVDHLATRMRRNAENLIVLSGATAGRTWRRPVPMIDVLRAALAEVEDFSRVTVVPPEPAALIGPAVGDVIHLLAELVENAVSFSPPQNGVRVGGAPGDDGFVIEVEDRGLGMSVEQRTTANRQLHEPPEFTLAGTARLGLYVVARLAQRHAIRVELRESPYGGTTAVVTLPSALITGTPAALTAGPDQRAGDRSFVTAAAVGLSVTGAHPASGRAAVGGQPVAGGVAPDSTPDGSGRPTGPVPSRTAAVSPSGLPVRQRRPEGEPAGTEPADTGRTGPPAARPGGDGRGTPTPLPGLAHLGDGPGASVIPGQDRPQHPEWTVAEPHRPDNRH